MTPPVPNGWLVRVRCEGKPEALHVIPRADAKYAPDAAVIVLGRWPGDWLIGGHEIVVRVDAVHLQARAA